MQQSLSPISAIWTDLSSRLPKSNGWLHSGIAINDQGMIYCAHPEGGALLEICSKLTRSIPVELSELHGIATTPEPSLIAVADPGYRMTRLDGAHPQEQGAPYREEWTSGRAVLLNTTDGSIAREFQQPAIPAYAKAGWRPTSIAIGEGIHGAEVWIADGYGENLVHRFTWKGGHLATFDAHATGTALNCPHGILTQGHGADLRILIADRANRRIVTISPTGEVQRVFGREHLDSPSSLTTLQGRLFVTELHGGIAEFDPQDNYVRHLEASRPRSHEEAAWPNSPGGKSGTINAPTLQEGCFNSPHGLTSHRGSLYLTEWLIGGRLIKLTPLPH
ncbi:NHL repeat-containing protein [Gulosibacter chungangensis]|uniref:Uncharacterized protein n=1 Tax=Gulosibacter chungangensis TaxID=979746 RepID=A0A7J5BF63_9MICO|nr:hypothetical protein [Gulosibacter chungangensis]KAB1644907.1 hypothetical protein F8O05_01160 [Gulosibacter chungangensis]